MKKSDLTYDFLKSMQNLEILYHEESIEDEQLIELITKYSV